MSASRLKGKPLLEINNIPIICHVEKKAKETGIGKVIVATEDQEIVTAVEKNNGKAILLTASIPELSDRLSTSGNRPLLPENNIEETLTQLWLDRQLHYLDTAEFTIETDGKTPEIITDEILNQLNP